MKIIITTLLIFISASTISCEKLVDSNSYDSTHDSDSSSSGNSVADSNAINETVEEFDAFIDSRMALIEATTTEGSRSDQGIIGIWRPSINPENIDFIEFEIFEGKKGNIGRWFVNGSGTNFNDSVKGCNYDLSGKYFNRKISISLIPKECRSGNIDIFDSGYNDLVYIFDAIVSRDGLTMDAARRLANGKIEYISFTRVEGLDI